MQEIRAIHSLPIQRPVWANGKSTKGWKGVTLIRCGSECEACRPDVDESETADELAGLRIETECASCWQGVEHQPPYLCVGCFVMETPAHGIERPTLELVGHPNDPEGLPKGMLLEVRRYPNH